MVVVIGAAVCPVRDLRGALFRRDCDFLLLLLYLLGVRLDEADIAPLWLLFDMIDIRFVAD